MLLLPLGPALNFGVKHEDLVMRAFLGVLNN
jgi:hypothetical protein